MYFGMPTLLELSELEETALLCKELGLDFIEINMNLPQYQIEKLENVDKFHKIADKYGIFYTIHLDENLNICDFNRAIAKAYTDTVLRTINVAKKLKIPVLNMHLNKGVYFTLPNKKIYLFDQYNSHYMTDIRDFRERCNESIGDADLKISIENTKVYMEFEKAAIECLLHSEAFALTWDIGHSHSNGNKDVPFMMEHADRLAHFHLHDAVAGNNHMTLGTGEINLNERITIAEQNNCSCVIETKTIEALRESVKWIRNKREHYEAVFNK